MLKDIIEARHIGDYRLHLSFEDNVEGEVDLAQKINFTGVFEPLKDVALFAQVQVSKDWETVYWPNGADLDPDVLYSCITVVPISWAK